MNLAQALRPDVIAGEFRPPVAGTGNLFAATGRGLHLALLDTQRLGRPPRILLHQGPGRVLAVIATAPEWWWKASALGERCGMTPAAAANALMSLHSRECVVPDKPSDGAGNRTHRRWKVTPLGIAALAVAEHEQRIGQPA